MGTVVVEVMPKSQMRDAQGAALLETLAGEGFAAFSDVRQGKRFVLSVDGPVTPSVLAAAEKAAAQVLVDPDGEDVVSVRAAGDSDGLDDDVSDAWDDMPEFWAAEAPIPEGAGQHDPKRLPRRTEVSAEHLRHVEAGSYYGRADDVRADRER